MTKYIESQEALESSLLLWDIRSTQTSIEETYELTVYPSTTYEDRYGAPVEFTIPMQPNGCLIDVEILTTWQIKREDAVLANKDEITVINNFSNALWAFVDVKVSNRVNLMQSMEQAYPYQTLFNTLLNSNSNREDYLWESECFAMDTGQDKKAADCTSFFNPLVLRIQVLGQFYSPSESGLY